MNSVDVSAICSRLLATEAPPAVLCKSHLPCAPASCSQHQRLTQFCASHCRQRNHLHHMGHWHIHQLHQP